MTTDTTTTTPEGRSFERPVRPRAWACFTESGNCIVWSTDESAVRHVAKGYGRAVTPLYDLSACPVAIMDTRDVLSLCAPTEADFPALYALQGHRVALVDLGPKKKIPDLPDSGMNSGDLLAAMFRDGAGA